MIYYMPKNPSGYGNVDNVFVCPGAQLQEVTDSCMPRVSLQSGVPEAVTPTETAWEGSGTQGLDKARRGDAKNKPAVSGIDTRREARS